MTRKQIARAREICNGCPVQRDCLAEAIHDKEEVGIWGGFTGPERLRAVELFDPAPLIRIRAGEPRTPDPEWESRGPEAMPGVLVAFDSGQLHRLVVKL